MQGDDDEGNCGLVVDEIVGSVCLFYFCNSLGVSPVQLPMTRRAHVCHRMRRRNNAGHPPVVPRP